MNSAALNMLPGTVRLLLRFLAQDLRVGDINMSTRRFTRILVISALAATLVGGTLTSSQAIPLPVTSVQGIAGPAPTEPVWWRGGWGGRGYGWGWRRPYYGGGALAAGLIGGLALGTLATSASPYYGYPYYGGYYPAAAPVVYGPAPVVVRRVVYRYPPVYRRVVYGYPRVYRRVAFRTGPTFYRRVAFRAGPAYGYRRVGFHRGLGFGPRRVGFHPGRAVGVQRVGFRSGPGYGRMGAMYRGRVHY
jgi:hypothetical protein